MQCWLFLLSVSSQRTSQTCSEQICLLKVAREESLPGGMAPCWRLWRQAIGLCWMRWEDCSLCQAWGYNGKSSHTFLIARAYLSGWSCYFASKNKFSNEEKSSIVCFKNKKSHLSESTYRNPYIYKPLNPTFVSQLLEKNCLFTGLFYGLWWAGFVSCIYFMGVLQTVSSTCFISASERLQ